MPVIILSESRLRMSRILWAAVSYRSLLPALSNSGTAPPFEAAKRNESACEQEIRRGLGNGGIVYACTRYEMNRLATGDQLSIDEPGSEGDTAVWGQQDAIDNGFVVQTATGLNGVATRCNIEDNIVGRKTSR